MTMGRSDMKVEILRGVPGAGKSAHAARMPGAFVVNSDRYFTFADGSYHFNARLLPAIHERCLADFRQALSDREPLIVVDKCNLSWFAVRPYAEEAREAGYAVRLLTFVAHPVACWKRNVHSVPRDKVFELDRARRKAVFPAWLRHETMET